MVFAILILFFGLYAYTVFNGTPWEKRQHEKNMQKYLTGKYETEFVLEKIDYNFFYESYQGFAYPKENHNLVFIIEEDNEASKGYSDNFSKVIGWSRE